MSEFRIVKCKSCDAALVELHGEKLKKCVQCGFSFANKVNNKQKLESVFEQALAKAEGIKTQTPQQNRQTKSYVESIKQSYTNASAKPTQEKQPVPKKPSSIIGTLIKWYIILFVVSGILKSFF